MEIVEISQHCQTFIPGIFKYFSFSEHKKVQDFIFYL
jgi:hypothetical protein